MYVLACMSVCTVVVYSTCLLLLTCMMSTNCLLLFLLSLWFHPDSAALDRVGARIEIAKYPEKLVPSTRFVAVDDIAPVVSENASFVAPSASVIGDVSLGDESRYVPFVCALLQKYNTCHLEELVMVGVLEVLEVVSIL